MHDLKKKNCPTGKSTNKKSIYSGYKNHQIVFRCFEKKTSEKKIKKY